MTAQQDQPITGYRVFFEKHWEDYPTLREAWERRCEHLAETGVAPYVHATRKGGPEFPDPR